MIVNLNLCQWRTFFFLNLEINLSSLGGKLDIIGYQVVHRVMLFNHEIQGFLNWGVIHFPGSSMFDDMCGFRGQQCQIVWGYVQQINGVIAALAIPCEVGTSNFRDFVKEAGNSGAEG